MCLPFHWILNTSIFSVRELRLFSQAGTEFYIECLSTISIPLYLTSQKKNARPYLAFGSGDPIKKYTFSFCVLIGIVLVYNKITFT